MVEELKKAEDIQLVSAAAELLAGSVVKHPSGVRSNLGCVVGETESESEFCILKHSHYSHVAIKIQNFKN